MAQEIELKFTDADHDAVRSRLQADNAEFLDRYFERNIVFDLPDKTLKQNDMLLRLRKKNKTVLVTLKIPPQERIEEYKVYEEIEFTASDFSSVRAVFLGLGYVEAFRYEKIREKWIFGSLEILLDTLPFGRYVELEGEKPMIEDWVRKLQLPYEKRTTKTYHELHLDYCRKNHLPPVDDFVFSKGEVDGIFDEIGK